MEASWVRGVSFVLFAYFLGSVPFGVLVTRLFDRSIDLRSVGSGNIGATNVARAAGKAAGILTLLLDAGKVIFAMVLANIFVVLFSLVVYFPRYVSLGSLSAAGALPPMMALLAASRHYVTLSLGMMFLVLFTHRENIRRLLAGRGTKNGGPKGRTRGERPPDLNPSPDFSPALMNLR